MLLVYNGGKLLYNSCKCTTYRAVIHAGPDDEKLQFKPSQAYAFGAQGSPIQFFFTAYFVRIVIMAFAVHMGKNEGNWNHAFWYAEHSKLDSQIILIGIKTIDICIIKLPI